MREREEGRDKRSAYSESRVYFKGSGASAVEAMQRRRKKKSASDSISILNRVNPNLFARRGNCNFVVPARERGIVEFCKNFTRSILPAGPRNSAECLMRGKSVFDSRHSDSEWIVCVYCLLAHETNRLRNALSQSSAR